MSRTTYTSMLSFHPGTLIDIYADQYKAEKGEKKLNEVMYKVRDSESVAQYIQKLVSADLIPTANQLKVLMNSMTYFMFSKAETLCLGGLATIFYWEAEYDPLEEKNLASKEILTCTEFIITCSQLKANVSDNLFSRFFRQIDKMCLEG